MNASSRLSWLAILAIAAASTSLPAQEQREVTQGPIVDHHAHLKSPAVARLFHVRLPPIELPQELDRVLRAFERHWRSRDQAALAALFAEDGIMQRGDAWHRGRPAIHIALLGAGGSDLRLWAQAFAMNDSLAYVVGSYGHRTLAHLSDLGRLHLSLRRGQDGVWRIAAAMLNNVNPPSPADTATFPAQALVAQLDSAGMRRAAVMSWAYQFGAPHFEVSDEYSKVRAENDWTAREAARFPARLVAFCSFNPIESYALEELDRCMQDSGFTGLKLHFTTSFVDLRNPQHVERLRHIFRTANARGFPMVVHMRTLDRTYGRRDAEIFLRDILAEAPDTPVQIAHAAGWGGYGTETDQALEVFAEAFEAGDPRTANLYFDLSGVVSPARSDSEKQLIVRRIRQIGVHRMLFAIDVADSAAQVRERWEHLKLLPLEDAELRTIAGNVAPYMR
jgi:predicted TIM-barrel fold metal-dependent hydrolase